MLIFANLKKTQKTVEANGNGQFCRYGGMVNQHIGQLKIKESLAITKLFLQFFFWRVQMSLSHFMAIHQKV